MDLSDPRQGVWKGNHHMKNKTTTRARNVNFDAVSALDLPEFGEFAEEGDTMLRDMAWGGRTPDRISEDQSFRDLFEGEEFFDA